MRTKSCTEFYNEKDLQECTYADIKQNKHGIYFSLPYFIGCKISTPTNEGYIIRFSWREFYTTTEGRLHRENTVQDKMSRLYTPIEAAIILLQQSITNQDMKYAHGAKALLQELKNLGTPRQLSIF
ncbi:MAG: hypothetical protein ACI30A_06775 [Paludibacteraceae bacterium]